MSASRAGAPSHRSAATPPHPAVAPPHPSATSPHSSHRPRAARSRAVPQLALGLIGLALVAVFLVGMAAPSAAFAANKKPSVTSLSPASGTTAGGTIVTVDGRAFTSFGRSLVTKVTFGKKAARYHVNAYSQVICTAPPGKGTVNVIITTKGGTTAKVSADHYTYKAPIVAPAITAFSLPVDDATVHGVIDQSAHTIAVTLPYGTSVTALVASFTTTGSAVKVGGVAQVSGVTANDFSAPVIYTVSAAGAPSQSYTVTVTVAPSSAKAITSFGFANTEPGVTGTIDQSAHTIAVTVPYGTPLDGLVASFTTTGAAVKVGDVTQVSGTTHNDFSDPVVYTVTAADGSTQDYTVNVTVALNPAKAITAFSFDGLDPAVTGTIDQTAHAITLTLPFGASTSGLVASFTTSGASVAVGDVAQVSGTTANDFSESLVYTVTAADGSTQDYTVTVTVALNPAKAITDFDFYGPDLAVGMIDQSDHSIAVTVPGGTDVSDLVASFTTTGASVAVGDVAQVSGTTANDFSDPVTYTVTAADGSTQDYTVTVTAVWVRPEVDEIAPSSGPLIEGGDVDVFGRGFTGATAVHFGTQEAMDFFVMDDSEMICFAPPAMETGRVDLTVTSPAGTSATSSSDQFTYLPEVDRVSPNSGDTDGGYTVTIEGMGLDGATNVDFGANNPAVITYDDYDEIQCIVPAWLPQDPLDSPVTVTVPAGTSNGWLTFHYEAD